MHQVLVEVLGLLQLITTKRVEHINELDVVLLGNLGDPVRQVPIDRVLTRGVLHGLEDGR